MPYITSVERIGIEKGNGCAPSSTELEMIFFTNSIKRVLAVSRLSASLTGEICETKEIALEKILH